MRVESDLLDCSILENFIADCKTYLMKFTQQLDIYQYEHILQNDFLDATFCNSLINEINQKVEDLKDVF